MTDAPADSVTIDGVCLLSVTERGCIDHVLDELDAGRGGWIVTVNLDILRQARRVAEVRELIGEASMCVADGMPLVWASRLAGTPLPERVAGSRLIRSLSGVAAERDRSVFLLGGNPGTADATADWLHRHYPALHVAGTCCPPVGFEDDEQQIESIRTTLIDAAPDIVYVALGFPKQERLIERLRGDMPAVWWMGVGISFSYLSGEVTQAPVWMQRVGLEWVFRFVQEPFRLGGRYLRVIPFGVGMLVRSFVQRFA